MLICPITNDVIFHDQISSSNCLMTLQVQSFSPVRQISTQDQEPPKTVIEGLESPLEAIEPGILSPPQLSSWRDWSDDSTVPAGIGPSALLRHRARWNVFNSIGQTLPHQAEKRMRNDLLAERGVGNLINLSISDPWTRNVSTAPISSAINVCLSQVVRAQYTLTTRAIWSIALDELHILDTLRSLRYGGRRDVVKDVYMHIIMPPLFHAGDISSWKLGTFPKTWWTA